MRLGKKNGQFDLQSTGRSCIDERPNRFDPRCVKRRPKPFKIMTPPRKQMKEELRQGVNTAKKA